MASLQLSPTLGKPPHIPPLYSLMNLCDCPCCCRCCWCLSDSSLCSRYKRVFSVGTHGITTYNPTTLEVTNQVSVCAACYRGTPISFRKLLFAVAISASQVLVGCEPCDYSKYIWSTLILRLKLKHRIFTTLCSAFRYAKLSAVQSTCNSVSLHR